MFERFTDRARLVVVLAQEEARRLEHHYIGTEHVLLGLVHEGEGVAARTLESLGISLPAVRREVEEIIGRGQSTPTGHIPFTPRAKKVLELSLRECMQLGHSYIGTEHILLGVIREGKGVGAQVLQKLGADHDRVRQQVILLLEGNVGTSRSSEAARRQVEMEVEGGTTLPAGEDVKQWAQLVSEAAIRGKRTRQLTEHIAQAIDEDGIDWLDVLLGILVTDQRLSVLEWVGRQDVEDLRRAIAELRRTEEGWPSEEGKQADEGPQGEAGS
jgi:ATP-dependent Clp protease ATP-binding subunit ClpC